MSRIPYPDYEKLSPVKRELVEKLGKHLLNVSRMAMHAPDPHWMGPINAGTGPCPDAARACVRWRGLRGPAPWDGTGFR